MISEAISLIPDFVGNATNDTIPWTDINLTKLDIFSIVLGWGYFAAWSISFYPQLYTNWSRKSVVGLSFDFLALNITGYVGYSIFNCVLFWSKVVQDEYYQIHGPPIPVKLNDVFFALHALAITTLTIFQCFIYERGGQKVHWVSWILIALAFVGSLVQLLIIFYFQKETLLQYIIYFSYVKVGCTLLKYMPQAYFNYQRKSTVGWSIGNILLDFTGGVLSFGQMFVDAYGSDNWAVFTGDPAKLALAMISIFFDILFMVQHYCLYRNRSEYSHTYPYKEVVHGSQQYSEEFAVQHESDPISIQEQDHDRFP